MAAPIPKTLLAKCPKCGHVQPEHPSAYSTLCKRCYSHYRLHDPEQPLRPRGSAPSRPAIEVRHIVCFECGTELEVPTAAESTMCKRCSSHVDLRDYQIAQTFSKNFRTYGRLVIEEKGYVLNTDSLVGEAIVKGRLIGKLVAKRTLEIYSSAYIRGTITTGCLMVPVGNHFRWLEPLHIGGAEIAGELSADLVSTGTVHLRSTARFFGVIQSAGLVVESGAVIVGSARIGGPAVNPPEPVEKPKPRQAKPHHQVKLGSGAGPV